MKRFIMLVTAVLISAAILVSCTKKSNEGSYNGNFSFGGSTTTEPIFNAAIEELKELYPDAYVSYDSQGSSVGVKGVISGTYTLGGASRDLKSSEMEDGAKATAIALDGVAVIVNSGLPMENISLDNLIAIYAGEITNWSEIGGPDAGIVVFNRDEASGTRDCFKSSTVKKAKKKFTDTAAIVTSNGDMVSKVASTPNSIGYCGFGYLNKDANTKPVSINGIAPEVKNVLSGDYAVSRSLNVIHNGDLIEGSFEKIFLDYLLSEEGQAIIEEEKFIPLN